MWEAIGEVIGMDGAQSAVVGWTIAVLTVAFATSRLPGLALKTLRGLREFRHELKHPPKQELRAR